MLMVPWYVQMINVQLAIRSWPPISSVTVICLNYYKTAYYLAIYVQKLCIILPGNNKPSHTYHNLTTFRSDCHNYDIHNIGVLLTNYHNNTFVYFINSLSKQLRCMYGIYLNSRPARLWNLSESVYIEWICLWRYVHDAWDWIE